MTDPSGDAPGDPSADPGPALTRREAAQARKAPEESASTGAFPAQVRSARNEFESQVAHARAEFEEANERIKQRTGRDLILAILIGVSLAIVLIGSLVFVKWGFLALALAALVSGLFEFCRALRTAGRRVDVIPHIVVGVCVLLAGYFLSPWLHWVTTIVAVAVVIVWRLIAQMAVRDGRSYGDVLSDVMAAGFVQLYVPFLASLCVVLLRQDGGEWWVLAFIAIVIAADTGAYASGLTFGKHPMAPLISPKKTWEGFAGAGLAALIAGLLLGLFMLGIPWWAGLITGFVILLAATTGDLAESMIKRDLGIKDMSSWIPGHGGVLDRLDSVLPSGLAALILYYLLSPLAA
ncbi:phosphatidate cytidylyltransferase [Microbacterium sp. P5_E9]